MTPLTVAAVLAFLSAFFAVAVVVLAYMQVKDGRIPFSHAFAMAVCSEARDLFAIVAMLSVAAYAIGRTLAAVIGVNTV